jgi:2-methylisocitrate lyase-like PEP mutase family enzyme
MSDTRLLLRKLLNGPEMVVAPFVYDCLQARLAQREGFKAIYMTGFGTAAARGFPDLGLLTMGEMVENIRALARSVDVPLICAVAHQRAAAENSRGARVWAARSARGAAE